MNKQLEKSVEEIVEEILDYKQKFGCGLMAKRKIKEVVDDIVLTAEKRERERIASTPIIQEFIDSTKVWYEELAPAFRKGKCIMCGRKIQRQKELCDALEALTNLTKE
jgi:hypothetical protein